MVVTIVVSTKESRRRLGGTGKRIYVGDGSMVQRGSMPTALIQQASAKM